MNEQIRNILMVLFSMLVLAGLVSLALYLISNNPQNMQDMQEDEYQNQAVEIIDGDTFRLESGEIVRLLCVDTPEKGKSGYDEAITFLGGRLLYENLTLEGNTTDNYGRLLRWVYVNNSLINKEIIEQGFGDIFEWGGEDCGKVK